MKTSVARTAVCVILFLLAPITSKLALQAQAGQTQNSPAAGTTVVVKMIDAVDSGSDSAGKQYRASVSRPVNADNGVTIAQGASATVTLARSGSGYFAQLASVTINGQPVAVTSSAATVTSAAQNATGSAVNAMNSVLGGLGHHVNAPARVSAVAMGQRVVLPPGTTLTFVLSQPPASNSGGSTAPAAQTMTAYAAPAGGATIGGGGAAAAASNVPATNQPVSAGALTANIQEALLGPAKQAGMFMVSPDGGHYAAPAMRGTHEVVVIDGVDGPEFDHAAHTWNGEALDFVFSSDGKHSCYVAQSGDDMVLVRDGKTAFKILTLKTLSGNAKQGTVVKVAQRFVHNVDYQMSGTAAGHRCLLSPSGEHVAVLSNEANASESGATYMFLDGVKSPVWNFIDPNQVAFVAEKLVYAAQNKDHTWHLVVNDKPGPTYTGVKGLLVNDDNSHYAFVGSTSATGWGVGADGVLGPLRGIIGDVVIASNGRVAYTTVGTMNGATGQGGGSGLYIDDKLVGTPDHRFTRVDKSGLGKDVSGTVVFSPDGKHVAFVKSVAGAVAPVIDGKVGRTYDSIRTIQFSPDSTHYFYVGTHDADFVVYDGQEMPREDPNGVSNFVFSQSGGSFAYLAKSAQAGTRMVVNGQASKSFYGLIPNSMTFSPDGKHYAYAVHSNVADSQFVRDGVFTNISFVIPFTTRTGPPHIDFPPLIFSDDGTRLAWGWGKSDGVSKDVISIDGQELIHGYSTYEFPQFSPDGKHFATMIWNANKYSLAMDGKLGPGYDEFLEVNRNVARFLDAHTFRFLGVKNGSVYRVTVNLGG